MPTQVGFKCPNCTGTAPSRWWAGSRGRSLTRWGAVAATAVVLVAAVGFALTRLGGSDRRATGAVVPYHVEVGFRATDGLLLAGTLDLPTEGARHKPGVLIVAGFGATTRDGIVSGGVVVDPFYRDLGDVLARAGFVVLRYDKRGTGESVQQPEHGPLTFEQHVGDALRALEYLRGRSEVDRDAVALIGHDQGGMIGLRLADGAATTASSAGRAGDLAALVLINTPGRPLGEVLGAEYRAVGDEAHRESAQELETAVATLLETGRVPEVGRGLAPIFQLGGPDYLREVFAFDPAEAAARVVSPTLIVHGQGDSSITDDDVQALRAALTDAPEVEVLQPSDAGHTLAQQSTAGQAAPAPGASEPSGDTHPEEMHPGASEAPVRDTDVLRRIAAWLSDTIGGASAGGAAESGAVAEADLGAGSWQPLHPAPLTPRVATTADWTGRELLVWGGASCTGLCDPDEAEPLDDGAAYDPAADTWRAIAPSPLSPRFDAADLRRPWPGFLFVWGGDNGSGVLADGAIYDPDADAWRPVAPSPLTARSAASAV